MQPSASYWNNYYSQSCDFSGSKRQIPSQFAAFIAQELEVGDLIVDLGCGSGRDSFFFLSIGHTTIAIDRSKNAIDSCRKRYQTEGVTQQAIFFDCDATLLAKNELIISEIDSLRRNRVVFYSRFFLHALDKEAESQLLLSLSEICRPGDIVALEYRTTRDMSLEKETSAHFRRYVNPGSLISSLIVLGFELTYQVEGFGFAKYKKDDAYVARSILCYKNHPQS